MKRLLVTVWVIFLAFSLLGCSQQVKSESEALMEKYRLHPDKPPIESKIKLNDSHTFDMVNSASKQIGFDLKEFKSSEVKVLSYPLKECSQGHSGKISANILYEGKRVIGAFLTLYDYCPGVVPLNERSDFAPLKLSPKNLQFEGVEKIELIGPWEKGIWTKNKRVEDSSEVKSTLALVRESVLRNGDVNPTIGDELYMLIFYFSDGPIVRARLFTPVKSFQTYLAFDGDVFAEWHYIPSKDLKIYVIGKLN